MSRLNSIATFAVLVLALDVGPIATQEVKPQPIDPKALEDLVDSVLRREMENQHIPGAVFAMVSRGQVVLKKGYGIADLESRRKVDPERTLFRIGSITKTFTATALMQLVDRKLIGLNHDVNSYLSGIQVQATYPEAVTPAHLLSHTAGFDEIGPGRLVFAEESVVPLTKFLQNRLIRVRPPGEVPAYSTYGIALAGLLVEQVTEQSLESYFKQQIWGPLGMNRTTIKIPDALENEIAIGYEYENGANQPQLWEWYHTFPASSISSTAADMTRYMLAHLKDGQLDGVRVLSEASAGQMKQRQSTGHERVNGFGYGFQENEWSGQRTIEHGGDMMGFSAYMVLIPDHNAGIFVAYHHEGSNLRYRVVAAIMEQFFSRPKTFEVPAPNKSFVTRAQEFTGSYRWLTSCITCEEGNRDLVWKITSNDDGTLSMIGRSWIEIEPLFFVSDDGDSRLGFRRGHDGRIRYLFLGNVDSFEKIEP